MVDGVFRRVGNGVLNVVVGEVKIAAPVNAGRRPGGLSEPLDLLGDPIGIELIFRVGVPSSRPGSIWL